MNRALVIFLLAPLAAQAVQDPTPSKGDPRVCEVNYDASNVVRVVATVGETVTIIFGKDEVVDQSGLALSDSDETHIGRTGPDASNVLYLKAKREMPRQPIAVRTTKPADGAHRDYLIEWSAIQAPVPQAPKNVALAANGAAVVPQAADDTPTCWQIRYLYPADAKAVATAQARVAWRKKQEDDAEAAMRAAAGIRKMNVKYVMQGDASLAPSEIWDNAGDGTQPRTEMHFAGRIPVILKPSGDDEKQDAQITNLTIEDNGVVKIIGIYPLIRLRDGDRVICIKRRGEMPPPSNTTTGTVSPSVDRVPR